MSDPKRFDDYTEVVDCNDCSHYWDSSCDGVTKGSRVGCNSFLATRNVVIPEKLNFLEKRTSRLLFACYGLLIIDILTLVVMLRG